MLVDPALDDAGARPPIEDTANPVPNPTVPLPMPAEDVVAGIDAAIVTHRHRDHLDSRAEELLPRDVPVFCQPEDEQASARARTRGSPGRDGDRVGRDRASSAPLHATAPEGSPSCSLPSSGFLLDGLYIAGDTVWYEGVAETIERHQPRVAVVNAGGAEFLEGGLIIMGADDVRQVAARVPTVVAVHLEALNHCFLTRDALREACPGVLVPEDGETLEL